MATLIKKISPYGGWKSPISAASLAATSISISDVAVDATNGWIYWVENRPYESPARGVIVRQRPSGFKAGQVTFISREINPAPFSARTGVHEYGGAPFTVHAGIVVFSDFKSRRLYVARDSIEDEDKPLNPVPITPDSPLFRYADLHISPLPPHDHLLCVREAHSAEDEHAEPINSVVSVRISPKGAPAEESSWEVAQVAGGSDFYSDPKYSLDGQKICFLSWMHPNMPWSGTLLNLRDASGNTSIIAGSLRKPESPFTGGESIAQPQFGEDGTLFYTTDRSGFWALRRWAEGVEKQVLDKDIEGEFAIPAWLFGRSNTAHLSSNLALTSYTVRATSRLALIYLPSGKLIDLPSPYSSIGSLHPVPIPGLPKGTFAAVGTASSGTQPAALTLFLLEVTGEPKSAGDVKLTFQVIKATSTAELGVEFISEPRAIEFATRGGRTAHAIFYGPKSGDFEGPENEKSPCVVVVHGGPTAHASPIYDLQTLYWTTRGWAVCQLNYGGSTGYGREYVSRLDTKWGITDVDDAVAVAKYMGDGGSAGGFTVLLSLSLPLPYLPYTESVFATGASLYGVADLTHLAKFTHKFEARYLDGLIGGTVEQIPEVYKERRFVISLTKDGNQVNHLVRSPVSYGANIQCPIIILQGSADKVVPPEQSELIVRAVRDNGSGKEVKYVVYEGEGHGFREAKNIADSAQERLKFFSKVLAIALPIATPFSTREQLEIDEDLLYFAGGVGVLALGGLSFVAYHGFRRFPSAEYLTSDFIKRGVLLRGYVTKVSDGDTIRFYNTNFLHRKPPKSAQALRAAGTIPIRLASIDAPELPHFGTPGQPLGSESRSHLARLVLGRRVIIKPMAKDRYGRVVGIVWRGPRWWRTDVGLEMVSSGFASARTDYDKTSGDRDALLKAAEGKANFSWVNLPPKTSFQDIRLVDYKDWTMMNMKQYRSRDRCSEE
ncbi:Dipeptidyl aminopeptidase [Gonapodya sp. JEL0774]|nr:Dipeptidyl aminopeptidase [Gonapodya sp. JEL0774]